MMPRHLPKRQRSKQRHGLSRKVMLASVASLLLASFSAFGVYLYLQQDYDPTEKLDTALRLLSKGDGESAARIASSIPPEKLQRNSDLSKRYFVIGTRERQRARETEQRPMANDLNEKAVENLERSRSYSFPDGFEGMANFQLGMALYDLFKWKEAEGPLTIATDRFPPGRADAIERLVDIDLAHNRRDIQSAMDRIEHWRTLPRSSAYDDERADLKEMQTLIAQENYDAAYALHTKIPEESPYRPNADLMAGRCQFALAKQADTKEKKDLALAAAEKHFNKILESPKTTIAVRRQTNLEHGKTLREMGKLSDAISHLSILRLSSHYEPESLAAGIEEIETLVDANRVEDAIDTLEHITKNIGKIECYETDWFPVSSMRNRIVETCRRLIQAKDYAAAARYASNLPSFCDTLDRLRLESELYELWGESVPMRPENEPKKQEYHRTAAKAYESLTNRLPRALEYNDWLWRAIENYRKGGAYRESNAMLERFLSLEPRINQPKGHFVRAKNLMSMDRDQEAMQSLRNIINSNVETPLIYDARLDLAKLYADEDAFDEAHQWLLENLSGDLRPESPIWRESLFELGSMLYSKGEKQLLNAKSEIEANPSKTLENFTKVEASFKFLKESIDRMDEFLRRFENDPRRFQILYQMAKAYRLALFWPDLQLRENRSVSEDAINTLKSQRKDLVLRARGVYRRLREEILASNLRNPSTADSDHLLRNSYFGEADLYFFEEEYDEAIVAYTDAANRFINEPEALEARKQIALCQKQLGKTQDCLRSLELARDLLQRIPPEKDYKFRIVTPHDRSGWDQYLTSMIAELKTN